MAQAFYPTNDGHIGNLQKLSLLQLLELIQRQEKLLKKKAFLQSLADKGEKITHHLEVLNQELQRRKQTSNTKTAEGSGYSQSQRGPNKPPSLVDDNDLVSDQKPNSACEQKLLGVNVEGVLDRTVSGSADNIVDRQKTADEKTATPVNAESLEADFERLQVQNGETTSTRVKHQYEIALERAEKHSQEPGKGYQRLNRCIHALHVEELPPEVKSSKPTRSQTQKPAAIKPPEESAAAPPRYRYEEVKVIPLDESLRLQTAQKYKQEELQARLAAEKLAQRLNIRMEAYNPEGVDMSYRSKNAGLASFDSDDDDDNEEEAGMADILSSDTED